MPLLIKEPHSLSDIEFNKIDTQAFLAQPGGISKMVPYHAVPEGYEFRKLKRALQFRLVKDGVTYFKTILHGNEAAPCECYFIATDESTWWDDDDLGLPAMEVMFRYAMQWAGAYQPGKCHTEARKQFWIRKTVEAFDCGYRVYIMYRTSMTPYEFVRVESVEEFLNKWVDYCWGDDPTLHPYRTVTIMTEHRAIEAKLC